MHEAAIALAVVREAEKLAKALGTKPKLVEVVVGELQSIDLEVLGECIRMNLSETLPGVECKIKTEPPLLRCEQCGYEWRLDMESLDPDAREAIHFLPEAMHVYVKCPRCGSRDLTAVRGREIVVRVHG